MKMIQETILQQGASLVGYLHEATEEIPGRMRRPAILICPGGGYSFRSARETDPPAFYFLSKGYQVFLLAYSVGEKSGGGQPLREASAAMTLLRRRADEWGVLPDRIAILGFSAGGHLAASLGVLWDDPALGAQNGENRPDAMVLCYPVITAGEFTHAETLRNVSGTEEPGPQRDYWSLEKHVSGKTPPAFLWHTYEDPAVPVENSLLMVAALRRAGVPCEFHLFEKGDHGLSLCTAETAKNNRACAPWAELCAVWLGNRFSFKEFEE